MRIAVYARLSIDDGTQLGTGRQVADCEAFAAIREWVVAERYVDRDTSAYQHQSKRPEWEAMLAEIQAGRLDGVVVWKLDRLVRRAADFERFWAIAEPHGAMLASVTEPIDTTTELGMAIVRILVVFAQLESATIATRVRRAKQQTAALGHPKHGGYRGYGHERDGSLKPAEAAVIVDAAGRVLGGESLSSIARSLRDQGARTPTGGVWETGHLRRLLMQARLAGARETGGEWVSGGGITPILSEAIVRQLRAKLTDPSRTTTRPRAHDALLTGLIYCAECGSRMVTGKVRDRRIYACRDIPSRAGCGRVAVTSALADTEVTRQVLDAIARGTLTQALAAPGDDPAGAIAERLAQDRRRLEQLAVDHYTGMIGAREHSAARAALTSRITTAEQALARFDQRGGLDAISHVDVATEWDRRGVEWRRRVLRVLVARVDCKPATRPINVWNPDRLSVTHHEGLTK